MRPETVQRLQAIGRSALKAADILEQARKDLNDNMTFDGMQGSEMAEWSEVLTELDFAQSRAWGCGVDLQAAK